MPGKKNVWYVIDELEFESEIDCALAKAFGEETPHRLIINEFELHPDTVKETRRACKYCQQPIRVHTYGALEAHDGPCGRPCLGGGVSVGAKFHDDRCILCGFVTPFGKGDKS